MKHSRGDPNLQMPVSFLDVLLNSLLMIIFVFYLMPVSDEKEKKKDPQKFEDLYRITLTWNDEVDDDVDIYVADPADNLVFFRTREKGLMYLDHDDRGMGSDTTVGPDGQPITIKHNEESVVIRGIMVGEYTVNVHMYRKTSTGPLEVTASLYQLKGADTKILEKKVILEKNGDEKTAFRFTMDENGAMTGTSDLPRSFTIDYHGSPDSRQPEPDGDDNFSPDGAHHE